MALLTSCGGDPEGHPRARPARVVRGRLEAAWHVGQVSVMSPSLFYLLVRRRIHACHLSYEPELLLSLSVPFSLVVVYISRLSLATGTVESRHTEISFRNFQR